MTVVPITWDSDQIRYHVGFQADLVEAPRQLMENVRIGRCVLMNRSSSFRESGSNTLAKGITSIPAL